MKVRRKYLEELGIPSSSYNMYLGKPFKAWKRRRKYDKEYRRTGVNPMDCWNLDFTFYLWMYEHICRFLEDADKIIDLTQNTFEIEGKEITLADAIDLMKSYLAEIIKMGEVETKEDHEYKRRLLKKVLDIWYEVIDHMWW